MRNRNARSYYALASPIVAFGYAGFKQRYAFDRARPPE